MTTRDPRFQKYADEFCVRILTKVKLGDADGQETNLGVGGLGSKEMDSLISRVAYAAYEMGRRSRLPHPVEYSKGSSGDRAAVTVDTELLAAAGSTPAPSTED